MTRPKTRRVIFIYQSMLPEKLDQEVNQNVIEQIAGIPMPNLLAKINDYYTKTGLDFETIKTVL